MADQKLTELTETTSLTATSDFYTVVGGASRKIQWDNALRNMPVGPVVRPATEPAKWLELDASTASSGLLNYSFNVNTAPQTDADNGIYRQGINIDSGGNRVNTTEVAYSKEQELNYLTGGKRFFEWHETLYDTDNKNRRLMTSSFERGDIANTLALSVTADRVSFNDSDDAITNRIVMDWSANQVSFSETTTLFFSQPQTNLITIAKNGGGTAQLFGLNANDELLLGGTSTDGVVLGAELRLNGGQNYIKPLNNNEAITLGKTGALVNKVEINAAGTELLGMKDPSGGHFKFIVHSSAFQIRDDANSSKVPFHIDGNSPTDSFRLRNSGALGIGTANPEAGIHIDGAANGGGLAMEERSAPGNPTDGVGFLYIDSSTGDLMYKVQHGAVVKTGTLVDFSAL